LSLPFSDSILIDLQSIKGDVLQISFPSAGKALANEFLFTSIISYLLGLGYFGLKCKTPPIPKDRQGQFDRELISRV